MGQLNSHYGQDQFEEKSADLHHQNNFELYDDVDHAMYNDELRAGIEEP